MSASARRLAAPEGLVWEAPAGADASRFEGLRRQLAALALRPAPEPVYTAKRRCIYRLDGGALGPIALKEVRSEGALRALWFGTLRTHPGLREFRAGAAFAARGGATPELLAAALEPGALGPRRVLIFLRWQDDAVDATRLLREHAPDPPEVLLGGIAAALVDAARLGLVHGRHATGNLLALPQPGGGWRYQAIDFAYARLAPGLDAEGLGRDAVRFAACMRLLSGCSQASALALLGRVAGLAWPDAAEAARARARLERALDRFLRGRPGAP